MKILFALADNDRTRFSRFCRENPEEAIDGFTCYDTIVAHLKNPPYYDLMLLDDFYPNTDPLEVLCEGMRLAHWLTYAQTVGEPTIACMGRHEYTRRMMTNILSHKFSQVVDLPNAWEMKVTKYAYFNSAE